MVRRLVTGRDDQGRSLVVDDGQTVPSVHVHTPGFESSVVWTTGAPPTAQGMQAGERPRSFIPHPGETVALTVTFPPDSVFGDSSFDPASAADENARNLPGLAELFEPDAPGMHTTPTVDYVVVLSGTLILDLDQGPSELLHPGDVVIQNGTRHAWRVPSDEPATIFVVLLGQGTQAP